MDTRAFLQAVWPAQGIYCLATPFKPDDAKSTYVHSTFSSIEDVVCTAEKMRGKHNLFFCVHTLKEHRVWNPSKRDKKTGELGAWERRTHANMKESRAFFFDLDIGDSDAKYHSRAEALAGLEHFLYRTQLPNPLVTSSGGGFHVYWLLTDPVESLAWRTAATKLRAVARAVGLRADPMRTNDQASVLRVVGTLNVKPGHEPRPCSAIAEGATTPTATFLAALDDCVSRFGITTEGPSAGAFVVPAYARRGNLQQGWDGPTATANELADICEHFRVYKELSEAGEHVDEPMWYHMLGLTQYLEDGERLVVELGKPNRTASEKLAKLAQYNEATGGIPPNCSTLDAKCGGDACARCPVAKLGKNPLLIAQAVRRSRALPPPTLNIQLASARPTAPPVAPPRPWKRTAEGITEATKVKEDGEEIIKDVVILPYDMFPFEVCERTDIEKAYSLWAIKIPQVDEHRVIKIESGSLQDIRALHALLLNEQVHVGPQFIDRIRKMLLGWMSTLQKQQRASRQFDHLGWADKDHTQFILPTTLLSTDGTNRPAAISGMVREVARTICTEGTLADQIELMNFYNDDKYLKHQFVILCGLAAPALQATDHAGLVVNCTGDSGGGKSSALRTAASLWGNPSKYVVNGTRQGATLLRQQTTVFTLANLPFCVDEITEHTDEEVRKFVLSSTQDRERERLLPNGQPAPVRETFKSTFYLCTSNKSFHNLLSQGTETSNASNMRVLEMWFPSFGKEGQEAAKAYAHTLTQCYGWIGPAALERYMKHRQYVDDHIRAEITKMDKRYELTAPERFYSAGMGTALVYGAFAKAHNLIPFDMKRLHDWLLDEHLPHMRGYMAASTVSGSPQAVLAAFFAEHSGQILITDPDQRGTQWATNAPTKIIAEHDRGMQRVYVIKETFRAWLNEHGHNALKIINDLQAQRVIIAMDAKRVIGAGTTFARGRAVCFTVDLTHPEFAAGTAASTTTAGNVVTLPRKGLSK